MDKSKMKKLAILGITGGLLVATQVPADAAGSNFNSSKMSAVSEKEGGCAGKAACKGKTNSTAVPAPGKEVTPGPDKNHSVNGTDNGQKFAMLNHSEGEMSESRLINQLTKENLIVYRQMSYEGKQLTRKIALENGDPNKAVTLAAEKVGGKTGKM